MDRERANRAVTAWLAESGLEHDLGARPGEHVVQLPGEAKLRTTTSLLVGDRGLSVSAFVVRRPDENHEALYRWLLARNLRLPGIAFALDNLGDVYLVGRMPLAAVTEESIDALARGGAVHGRLQLQRPPRDGLPDLDEEGVGLADLAR